MEKNGIVKSEIGSEAAWRGFSTQTLYIAKRLLTAEDDEQLYPEQVEDLMIMRKGKITYNGTISKLIENAQNHVLRKRMILSLEDV